MVHQKSLAGKGEQSHYDLNGHFFFTHLDYVKITYCYISGLLSLSHFCFFILENVLARSVFTKGVPFKD